MPSRDRLPSGLYKLGRDVIWIRYPPNIQAVDKNANYIQYSFAWGETGTESGHTIGTENADLTLNLEGEGDADRFLRFVVHQDESSADLLRTQAFRLQYQINAGGYATIPTTAGSNPVYLVDNGSITHGADTTSRLTDPSGSTFLSNNNGVADTSADTNTATFTQNPGGSGEHIEVLYSLRFQDAQLSADDVLDFRLVFGSGGDTAADTALDSYTVADATLTWADAAKSVADGVDLGDKLGLDYQVSAADGVKLDEDFDTVWLQSWSADGVTLEAFVSYDPARSASDGVDVGDTLGVGVGDSVTDGVDVGDSATIPADTARAASDGVKLGENFTTVWTQTYQRDGVDLGDGASYADPARAASDGVDVGDSLTVGVGDALSDGVDVGDQPGVDHQVTASDGVDLGDTPTYPSTALTDGVKLGENFTTVWTQTYQRDGVDLGDSVTIPAEVSLTDGVKLGEDFTTTVGESGEPDGVVLDATLAVGVGDALSDGVDVGDSPAYDAGVAVADGVDLADALSVGVGDSVTDSVDMGDAASYAADPARAVADGVDVGDSLTVGVGDSLSDGVEFGDAPTYVDADRSAADGISLADALALMLAFDVTISDGMLVGDSLGVDHQVTASDGVSLGDAPTFAPTITFGSVNIRDLLCGSVSLSDRHQATVGVSP